ncbi:MAG: hypothetical protein VR65_01825 [Desulfobulbaceae bacterium BRH_c16a]|nr:MAG: hypothetical protein VR65_01825 [Desulfobulbaceae bacterium BRH_c16a]
MVHHYSMYINGQFVDSQSGRTTSSTCPADGKTIATFPMADATDVDLAVKAAERAFRHNYWSQSHSAQDRAEILHNIAKGIRNDIERLAKIEVMDSGKTMTDVSTVDMHWAADCFEYYAGLTTQIYGEVLPVPGDVLDFTLREPLGVCAAIVAWNYPIMFAAWKIAPALATGNTIIFKPALLTSLSALELAGIIHRSGAPDGVVNIVTGSGSEIGEALCHHPGISKIAFTGSTETGRKVMRMAASTVKKVSLELGGKSPHIIFDDIEKLDNAVGAALLGIFFNAGQTCIAGSRLYVQERIYEDFKSELLRRTRLIPVGNGMDDDVRMGSIISEDQMNLILQYIESGKREGAKLLAGGRRLTQGELSRGFYIAPTIFECEHDDYTIVREEIFGPVLCLMKFSSEDEVIQRANHSPYGLAAGVWTSNIKRGLRLAKQLNAGQVWINQYLMISNFAPHGGFKQSGYGKDLSKYAIDQFTQLKNVYVELCDEESYITTFE